MNCSKPCSKSDDLLLDILKIYLSSFGYNSWHINFNVLQCIFKGAQGKFGPRCAAEPFKPWPCLRQKLFISLLFLRQDILFHDPDSFRFAQEIKFSLQASQSELFKKYIACTTYGARASHTL